MKSSDSEEEAVGKAAVEAVTYISYLYSGLRDRADLSLVIDMRSRWTTLTHFFLVLWLLFPPNKECDYSHPPEAGCLRFAPTQTDNSYFFLSLFPELLFPCFGYNAKDIFSEFGLFLTGGVTARSIRVLASVLGPV